MDTRNRSVCSVDDGDVRRDGVARLARLGPRHDQRRAAAIPRRLPFRNAWGHDEDAPPRDGRKRSGEGFWDTVADARLVGSMRQRANLMRAMRRPIALATTHAGYGVGKTVRP